jgi:hypothetical protein
MLMGPYSCVYRRVGLKGFVIGSFSELRFKAGQVLDFLFEDDVGRAPSDAK